MGQILHGCARTTQTVRRTIQKSHESIMVLAAKYAINPKIVVKWKKRKTVQDAPMGPKEPASTVLAKSEEALIVAFRKHTLLPLDDCLYALQASMPKLTRSSLHRCLLDIAEVRAEEGKLHLFVPIDHTSKFVTAKLTVKATTAEAQTFFQELIAAVPYTIHTILTDNGIQFADTTKNSTGPTAMLLGHPFDRVCRRQGMEHRLTKPNHPWTNGHVERMNRTSKEAMVNRSFYQTHAHLEQHLKTFVNAYNFVKRLKTLRGLTPFEFIVRTWAEKPELLHDDPAHLTLGLYT